MKASVNPFEGSFEDMTSRVVKPIKKAVSDATATVAADVKQQVSGNVGQDMVEQMGVKPVNTQTQQKIQNDQAARLAKMRGNLKGLNERIVQIRKEWEQQELQKKRAEVQKIQEKKIEERQKSEEPMWKQLLKGRQGSGENKVNVGG